MSVIKKAEYRAFIKHLKFGTAAHWVEIAKALNVDNDTITNWKKLPEAQLAIQEGIDQAIAAMEQAGRKDWRMWEAKLKMLGVNPPDKSETKINIEKPIEIILSKYGLENAGQTKETSQGSSEDTA